MTDHNKPQIVIVGGAGHVGLPLAIVFADCGVRTLIYDINRPALDEIKKGILPFIEINAEEKLKSTLESGMLTATDDISQIKGVPNIIITIGTPVDEFMNPVFNLLSGCIDELIPHLDDDQMIVLRSTISPGVTAWLSDYLQKRGKKPLISFCPERIVQGKAVEELKKLPQLISGTSEQALSRARDLFKHMTDKIVEMEYAEAEFAKLFCNAYRYIQFAASNQFLMLARQAGLDYSKILNAMKQDYERLNDLPGAGFAAGPCLFKDTMQLVAYNKNQFGLGMNAMMVNEGLPLFLIEQLRVLFDLKSFKVVLLGMAFKANIDDNRSSLSYKLKNKLKLYCDEVLCTDPYVQSDQQLHILDDCLKKGDLFILCVPHSDYANLDVDGKPVVDIWDFYKKGWLFNH